MWDLDQQQHLISRIALAWSSWVYKSIFNASSQAKQIRCKDELYGDHVFQLQPKFFCGAALVLFGWRVELRMRHNHHAS